MMKLPMNIKVAGNETAPPGSLPNKQEKYNNQLNSRFMDAYLELTDEKFQEIYINPEFRNQVANAHQVCNSKGEFKFRGTCSYPLRWRVTDTQIRIAKQEWSRAKSALIKQYKKDRTLVLIGMGSIYTERYSDDVCNWRVRGYFKSPAGRTFFIEFGTGRNNVDIRIDHAIEVDIKILDRQNNTDNQSYNDYKGLERKNTPKLNYTKSNLLMIVNHWFECRFKKIVIDNYTLSPDDIISLSPDD